MAGLGGLAIGAGLAQGLAGFGKSYLDTINTYEDNALKKEQIAISKEAAMMKRAEYEKGIKPIRMSDLAQKMDKETFQPLYETAKNMGIIKGQGADEYAETRDWNEFGENLKKNSIAQAQLLTKSMSLLDQERGGLQQQAQAIGGRIKEFEESWKFRMQQLQKDAGEKGEPINFPKKAALEKEMKEFESQGLYQQYEQLAKMVAGITDKHFRVQHQLGILDDIYKKDAEKYGKEVALRIHSNMMTREQADRILLRQKKEEEARAVAMTEQIKLPFKLEEAAKKEEIKLKSQKELVDYKKKHGVDVGTPKGEITPKDAAAKVVSLLNQYRALEKGGTDLYAAVIASQGGNLPQGFGQNMSPEAKEEIKSGILTTMNMYAERMNPEDRKKLTLPKMKEPGSAVDTKRNAAIEALKANNKPVTEKNIKFVMDQMK